MELFDYIKFLGMYWGEYGLQPLVESIKIIKPPKIAKGETDGYLLFKKLGVELIFTDERSLNIPSKSFPEGAMVLSNITFYLAKKDGYHPYTGKLPDGMKLGASKTEIIKVFGLPNTPQYSPAGELLPDEDDWMMRWDKDGFAMFCTFSEEGFATDLALQLPLDQA